MSGGKRSFAAFAAHWALILALETAFWVPFCLVPVIAKLAVGEPLFRGDLIACAFLSGVLAVLGTSLGRYQAAYRIALFPLLAIGALTVTLMALSKQGILNPFAMLAIIDTDLTESSEFASRFDAGDIGLAILLLLPVISLAIQARKNLFLPRLPYARTALVALFVGQLGVKAANNSARAAHSGEPLSLSAAADGLGRDVLGFPVRYLPVQPYLALYSAVTMRWEIAEVARKATPVAAVKTLEPARRGRTYVVIVGEALSRQRMHLYGYDRDTTPRLDRLAANGDLLVFRDVVTSRLTTVAALAAAFRFQPGSGQDGHTLFDVLNGAGFKTYWISNQYQYGVYESAVSLLTSATSQIWLNQPLAGGVYSERRSFDSELLPALRKVLASGTEDKFIFLHMMGGHDLYASRYPLAWEHFSGVEHAACRSPKHTRAMNEYDNAVRYSDFVIEQIFETVNAAAKAAGNEALALYFSDHGEEVYDFRDFAGHNESMMSPYLAQIPFIAWLSDEYKRNHPEFVAGMAAAQTRPYVTSDLLYSIADLARLSFPGFDPARSIFSTEFKARRRMTAGRDFEGFMQSWTPDARHASPFRLIECGNRSVASRLAAKGEPVPEAIGAK